MTCDSHGAALKWRDLRLLVFLFVVLPPNNFSSRRCHCAACARARVRCVGMCEPADYQIIRTGGGGLEGMGWDGGGGVVTAFSCLMPQILYAYLATILSGNIPSPPQLPPHIHTTPSSPLVCTWQSRAWRRASSVDMMRSDSAQVMPWKGKTHTNEFFNSCFFLRYEMTYFLFLFIFF